MKPATRLDAIVARLQIKDQRIDSTSIMISHIINRIQDVLEDVSETGASYTTEYYESFLRRLQGELGLAEDNLYGINQ